VPKQQTMASAVGPGRSLPLEVDGMYTLLPASDAAGLIESIDTMIDGVQRASAAETRAGFTEALQAQVRELEALQAKLAGFSGSALQPLELEQSEARLLRRVIADLTGYQRGELTSGLRELREILSVG
jgi:hypothetical protein